MCLVSHWGKPFFTLFVFSNLFFVLLLSVNFQGCPSNIEKAYLQTHNSRANLGFAIEISDYVLARRKSLPIQNANQNIDNLTRSEIEHLRDVKKLFHKIRLASFISLFLVIIFGLILSYFNPDKVINGIIWGQSALLFIIFISAIFSLIDFGPFFSYLHLPFFKSQTWVFAADSVLIQLFPEFFWNLMLERLLVTVLLGSISLIAIALIIKSRLPRF